MRPGDSGSMISIMADREGVVALKLGHSGDYFILHVQKQQGSGFRIDLENHWVPVPGRLGQALFDGGAACIQVAIGSDVYTTNPDRVGKSGYRYVPDANLLCRYLVGEATAEEVEAAASAHIEEQNAREQVPKLGQLVRERDRKIADLQGELATMIRERDGHAETVARLQAGIKELEHAKLYHMSWREAGKKMVTALTGPYNLGDRLLGRKSSEINGALHNLQGLMRVDQGDQ